jgi:probable F420-dependent oxidoreductase
MTRVPDAVSGIRLALGLGGSLDHVAAAARDAERAGFESAWVAELSRSAFAQAASAINATERIRIGTAVALALPRSPTITAMEAAGLAEASGDRFLLGLGSQVKRVMEARYSVQFDHPAARLADYVQAVRAVWAATRGEAVTHEGPFYRITMPTFHGSAEPGRTDVPILLAAVGPLMSRTAGTVADGLIGHPLASPAYLERVVRPAVAEGVTLAGRPATACPITATVVVSLGTDTDEARRAARLQLAFYATTRNYAAILRLHDREPVVRVARRAFVRGDREAMIAAIDDDLLDAIAIAGRTDEARDRLAAWEGVAGRAILAPPWYGVSDARGREMHAAILDSFRGQDGPWH